MVFQNIDFHNVSELTRDEFGGYVMHRFPLCVEETLSEGGRNANKITSGIELRFKLISDSVKLKFRLDSPDSSATTVYIYRGNIVGGWQECSVAIVSGETRELVVNKHPNIEKLREITKSASFGFSPEVVRIVLNSSILRFVGVDGDVVPPSKEDVPEKTYLAYGSSITHGSLALNIPSTFVSQIGEHFRCDVRNLGLAGNARLEKSVADEIAAMGERGEWDFASLCMGINILNIECSDFEKRVKNMIKTVAERNPEKHIFCISPFYCREDMDGLNKPQLFREIVERSVCELGFPYVHYIDGRKILDGSWGLSGDFVHPSPLGVRAIADGLIEIYSKYIKG
ncbi:MAG: SGNH/GDSL hydrolase family protein [Clostridia bacterium]|nr:SGNH/GDSL hydrolase family protein [Clostridia bacterium]